MPTQADHLLHRSNAVKFTDHSKSSFTIQGIEKSGRHQPLMSIEDSGIGIDPEEGKALFSRFRQIDSAVERENPVALTA
ncbi:MAG: ATP-binding protein [Verrucomicrobiota bacterium]|nr:ATP-binding protein [Verrucomicrobiota bacterium]